MVFPKFLKIAIPGFYRPPVKNSEGKDVQVFVYDRVASQFTEILAQAAGFKYTRYAPYDGGNGVPRPDGNWTGVIGMAQRGEVDLVVSRTVMTEERRSVVDFSYPFQIDSIAFVTRKAEYSVDVAAILKPFSYDVWIAISICLIILPLIFTFIEGKTKVFQKTVLYTFGTVLQQSCFASFKNRLVLVFWLICVMFLGYFYKAILLSYMTIQPITGVRTIPELSTVITKGDYQCKTYSSSFLIGSLIKSTNPDFQVIGDELQRNDGLPMHFVDYLKNTDILQKPAFIGLASDFYTLKDNYFVSDEEFFSVLLAIVIRKDFCCKDRLDKHIAYITAAGLYNKLFKEAGFIDSLKISLGTSDENLEANNIKKLSMTHFKLAFILLVSGNVLAFIVLLVEIIFKKL